MVNTAILRPQGNKQEDESQYAKNDDAYSQEDPGAPRALLGGELRTPICLSCQCVGGLSVAAKHFPKWYAIFSHLAKGEKATDPQLLTTPGKECAQQL